MIDSIFIAQSGLGGHEKGLKTLSNNVANMNTPGFKSSQAQFADVFLSSGGDPAGAGADGGGSGVQTLPATLNFAAGEIRATGRDLDAALDGPGFFVLRDDNGRDLYTKAGRFEFDANGRLVTVDNGFEVMALSGGRLHGLEQGSLKMDPPVTTTSIVLNGNLTSTPSSTAGVSDHTISNVQVFDAVGGAHTLTVKLVPGTGGQWAVTISEGATTLGTGTFKIATNSPDPLFSSITFPIAASGQTATITLKLGPNATGFSTGSSSTLAVEKVDGRGPGSITKFGFDDTGTLVVSYSNGQTRKGGQLAIAEIGDMDQLEQVSGALFRYSGSNPVNLTVAGTRTKLATASLELSNVDLTDQLSSLILVQRGYQASSQVLSTASEMIQDLYEMKSRR